MSSFQRHNLVSMLFIYAQISRPQREKTLCEVRSEFPQPVLLPSPIGTTTVGTGGDWSPQF